MHIKELFEFYLGAFLLPYFVSVIVAGVPLFLLEVALGQFMSKGAIAAWDICPLFRGTIQWDLALCLLLAWTIIFLAICRGIKTSGKIMYITATTPYIFMIILLVRTAQLEGALNGITYYLKPDWDKLTDMTVWSDAGTQIFFSYAIGLGALSALGSYNRYHHNSVRDCLLFAGANTFTSLLAGFVIFATLGNMSYISNVPIHLIAESGPGLAFIIYPKALGTLPGSPIWSFCFFIMIILLGIDSMFGGVEGFVAAISDYLPQVILNPWYRVSFVAATCIISYGIGLFMVTNVSNFSAIEYY
ncbi:solute carrier family 6 (neurotransmitter transporter, GABA) member 6/8/11/12/13 [Schistosoma bovis]|uniref:Solute carrier family 6 (Neurotransmitter transporter, GABA) member 6/8/11/12/13 n=1 Tax=Schistosoma bovis TaxID=6184 RepID=A0A430Q4U1_SCHBO|nr:solute carrier family 6 (neurotransmitter transporter, GABA) member 6/8/11/12/13 [Schistosoma bovis]